MQTRTVVVALAVSASAATPALAQRFPFERTFTVADAATLDVSTIRGKIDVAQGEPGRVVVRGTVTVRVGWNVPADAPAIAQKVAAHPPVRHDAGTVELRAPADRIEQRAVTVSYEVQVPPGTRVVAVSDSGATSVRGVTGPVSVRTQSAAIELARLGPSAEVTTGSGAVTVDGVSGALTVNTSSGGITAQSIGGNVRVQTGSGAVAVELTGDGDADVETQSSAIDIRGARRAVTTSSRSGHIAVSGVPTQSWTIESGSGGIDVVVDPGASMRLDASSRSGSVRVDGLSVHGSVAKQHVAGDVGSGGPLVRISSRSGSIRVTTDSGTTR